MPTILVVDDRAINREFLSMLLGYAGYRVLEAADGAEALDKVRSERPALVITGVLMPTMDGIEFANRLHAEPEISRRSGGFLRHLASTAPGYEIFDVRAPAAPF